jgi:hypothetical protein
MIYQPTTTPNFFVVIWLDRLSVSELTVLLAARIPQICFIYNGKQDCRAGNECLKLHLCRHFVEGECKYPGCSLSHDVLSEQPKAVLAKYGFNLNLGADRILATLRSKLEHVDKHDKQDGDSASGSGTTDRS